MTDGQPKCLVLAYALHAARPTMYTHYNTCISLLLMSMRHSTIYSNSSKLYVHCTCSTCTIYIYNVLVPLLLSITISRYFNNLSITAKLFKKQHEQCFLQAFGRTATIQSYNSCSSLGIFCHFETFLTCSTRVCSMQVWSRSKSFTKRLMMAIKAVNCKIGYYDQITSYCMFQLCVANKTWQYLLQLFPCTWSLEIQPSSKFLIIISIQNLAAVPPSMSSLRGHAHRWKYF